MAQKKRGNGEENTMKRLGLKHGEKKWKLWNKEFKGMTGSSNIQVIRIPKGMERKIWGWKIYLNIYCPIFKP